MEVTALLSQTSRVLDEASSLSSIATVRQMTRATASRWVAADTVALSTDVADLAGGDAAYGSAIEWITCRSSQISVMSF